jgi:hypothetical protein
MFDHYKANSKYLNDKFNFDEKTNTSNKINNKNYYKEAYENIEKNLTLKEKEKKKSNTLCLSGYL